MKSLKFEKLNSAKFTELEEMKNVVGGVDPTYEWKATKGESCTDEQLYTYNVDSSRISGADGPKYDCCGH